MRSESYTARVTRALRLVALIALISSCRHSGASTCNVAYNCAAGQTCTKTDPNEPFACLPAGPSQAGDPCYAGAGAPVTCGERLTCLATGNPNEARCVAWCDDAHPCAAGTECTTVVSTVGDRLRVCAPCNLAYACGAGQTCATRDGNAFTCVPAGPNPAGAPCDVTVGAPNTCAELHLCFSRTGVGGGRCTRWCDRTHPCLANHPCTPIKTTRGAVISVCL
jgi:hypothetical protein